jgi:hypothetical protein
MVGGGSNFWPQWVWTNTFMSYGKRLMGTQGRRHFSPSIRLQGQVGFRELLIKLFGE